VLGAKERPLRKSWVMWQEERAPNLVIELLSDSTKYADRGIKKEIYQDILRVPEYILHDVVQNTFEAFRLENTGGHLRQHYEYQPNTKTAYSNAVFLSQELGLELVVWEGEYEYRWDYWLRWRDPETGELLPTGKEIARREYKRAEQESLRAEQEHERSERLAEKLRTLGINPDDV
jgi:Putative restriction endonuclease